MRLPLLACVLVAGCSTEATEPSRYVMIGDDVVVTADVVEFPIDTHQELAPIQIDDLVAGTQSGGFVRQVVDVSQADGLVTLVTTDVPLGTAIGSAHSRKTFDDQGKADGDENSFVLQAEVRDIALTGAGPIGITLSHARVAFKPTLALDAELADYQLEHFKLEAAGKFEGDLALTVSSTVGGRQQIKKPLWETQQIFVQWIGWVPVVEVAELEIGVQVDVKAEGAFTAQFDASLTAFARAGVEYNGGTWTNLGGASVQRSGHPIVGTGRGEVAIDSSLYANISVHLYGIAGPFIEIRPSVKLRHGAGGWSRTVGVFGDAGADLSVPFADDSLQRYSARVFDYTYPL